jgi:2,3-bisphosphoglycerate-dependent phosphoglycerate mutase
MSTLVLLRHGQSLWNLENRFAGWSDIPLTPQGEKDAALAGSHLKDFHFDIAFTSRLVRSWQTLDAALLASKQKKSLPIEKDSALNERHYGDLQGLNKAETAGKYGQEKVHQWRRSFATRPPNGESIEDCVRRVTPFFRQYILPLVTEGKNVLVVAHGNSLRPILMYLDNLDPDVVAEMEIGLCTPYIYTYEGEKMVKKEIREIPGIVTKGASTTETTVEKGRV